MADVASIGGNAFNVDGWALTRNFIDPVSGDAQIVYKGRADTLDSFLKKLEGNVGYDKMEVQKDEATSTATVTITKAYGPDSTKPAQPSGDEVALPDVTLQGSMLQVPLCQAPFFGLTGEAGDGEAALTVQRVKTIDYIIREKGTITLTEAGSSALGQKYAAWLLLGMKTFSKPVYTLSITYHLRVDKPSKVSSFVETAGTVLTFSEITGSLPARLKVYEPDGFDAWLAQAPTVRYGAQSIDVTQTFIGAKKWPEYYIGGTWTAPGLKYSAKTE